MSSRTLHDQDLPAVTPRQRNRARMRLAFGFLQIMGASTGLYLLVRTGLTAPTVIVVTGTLVISIISRVIFRVPRVTSDSPKRGLPCS